MKTITYEVFIEKADRTFIKFLNKIWRFSAESVQKVGLEVARVLLSSIEQPSAESVASYQCAKDLYDRKQQEFQQAEQQAILAYQSGNTATGNLAIGKAIAIKLTLPELALQLKQAEQMLKSDRKLNI
jgi:phage shock protein A